MLRFIYRDYILFNMNRFHEKQTETGTGTGTGTRTRTGSADISLFIMYVLYARCMVR